MSVEITCGKCGDEDHKHENVKISKRCIKSIKWQMSIMWAETIYIRIFT